MTTRGATLHASNDARAGDLERPPVRLPLIVYVLALGTFLMGTTEFVVAGLLPVISADLQVGVAQAGLLITVLAVGMIVGAPLMAMLTLRLPQRWTLLLALAAGCLCLSVHEPAPQAPAYRTRRTHQAWSSDVYRRRRPGGGREDPEIIEPTDAIVRLTATCICGSDLWPYRGVEPADHQVMGHEYVGVVEEVGSRVKNVKVGDFVVGSFVISDNTCEICQTGFQSKCVRAEFVAQTIGTQAEKARIPHADGTLVATTGQPDRS